MRYRIITAALLLLSGLVPGIAGAAPAQPPLPGTQPLTLTGDPAAEMVSDIDHYLDRALAQAAQQRAAAWRHEFSTLQVKQARSHSEHAFLDGLLAYAQTNRARLRTILGVVDPREPVTMHFEAKVPPTPNSTGNPAEVGRGPNYRIYAVWWNVFRGVRGEGLLLVPDGQPKADVIAVPDCDWTPEQLVGLQTGLPAKWQFARRLAEAGCRVVVPCLIDRGNRFSGNPGVHHVGFSQREELWRASYELGRTLAGYEIQKVLAAADWLTATRQGLTEPTNLSAWLKFRSGAPRGLQSLGIIGYGEGGMIAFYAAALDPRFRAAAVCGYFGLSARLPEEPIYRNVWTLLRHFGDADVARLIYPRPLWIEYDHYPVVVHTDRHGGAPGHLWQPTYAAVARAWQGEALDAPGGLIKAADTVGSWATLSRLYRSLQPHGAPLPHAMLAAPQPRGPLPNAAHRERRQYVQILDDTQWLMREAQYTRSKFWQRADFKSVSAFTNSARWYRRYFASNIVGLIPPASVPPNPRTRFLYETNGFRGYQVMLDVHPGLFAYGILLVPTDIRPGEHRPVVVCQHGLEGRPRDVADPRIDSHFYHQFACHLAERGFVTFAPQNPYIGGTRFRQLLRKSQPLGWTLWSFIIRQHQVITDWLASLDFVDPKRIAFYGLSYGGKTAMRVPVLVPRYCLSICAGDYNEWIWKCVSDRSPYSYLWTQEYDMYEFNLANTFNYAELSWLIFPRPFMVERGHSDPVAPDEWVAYEYARTRRFYDRFGLGKRTRIEFFNGPHTIHGVGTFKFLSQQLDWPPRSTKGSTKP